MPAFDGLLTVCFGTADPAQMKEAFFPAHQLAMERTGAETGVLAVSSGFLRRRLAGKGLSLPSPEEALESLLVNGARNVLVQPLLFASGEEWEALQAICRQASCHFPGFTCMPPLLPGRAEECARVLDSLFPRRKEEGWVLLGHGSRESWGEYALLQRKLWEQGREDLHVLLLHGKETPKEAAASVAAMGYKKVSLAFLMFCAGHHAREAVGEKEGIKSLLEAEGLSVSVQFQGMGHFPAFVSLFLPGGSDFL